MTLPELIEVLKAAALGKTIEARAKGSEQWSEVPLANVGSLAARLAVGDILRVKPETPREWCAAVFAHSRIKGMLFESEDDARNYYQNGDVQLTRVREVLE